MHSKRNFGLDVARAVAITMVFLSHGISFCEPLGVGVDLFFVLSGFLIGRIYLRAQPAPRVQPAAASRPGAHEPRGTFSFWGFWQARWFRTLPPYLAALGLYAVADRFFHNNTIHLYYLAFLQNYLGMDGFGPSWSLSVEEHFYLALPLLGWLALRTLGRRALVWLLPLLALLPQTLRLIAIARGGLPPNWYWQTHLHSEGLVLGVWLAYCFCDRPGLWRSLRIFAAPAALLPFALLVYQSLVPSQPLGFRAVVFLAYAIGYSGWLRLLYDLRFEPRSGAGRLVRAAVSGLALASYSIYLLHTLLFTDLRVLVGSWPRGPLKTGFILGTALLLSVLFYFAVERPTILLRDRLLARKPPSDAQPQPQPQSQPATGVSA